MQAENAEYLWKKEFTYLALFGLLNELLTGEDQYEFEPKRLNEFKPLPTAGRKNFYQKGTYVKMKVIRFTAIVLQKSD